MTDKILIDRAVVEQALLALRIDDLSLVRESVNALRAALEQPPLVEQEPVAWGSGDGYWVQASDKSLRPDSARFTIPFHSRPQPKREPLTDQQIDDLGYVHGVSPGVRNDFARSIERTHGIK